MSARSEGGATRREGGAKTDLPYQLTYMFHPTILVPDLTASEQWYEAVFGLPSIRRDVGFAAKEQDPDNRTDFSTFTMIRDILMDYIDPDLFISRGSSGFLQSKCLILRATDGTSTASNGSTTASGIRVSRL